MNDMKISTIFPTTICQTTLQRDLTQEELSVIFKHKWTDNIGNLVGTNTQILNVPEFYDIKKFIEQSVKDYFLILYPDRKDVEIYIHTWFGPCPNGTVRATPHPNCTCTPDCTPRGPVQGFQPAQCRAHRQLLGARAAPRPNGNMRAGPHAARSRARLPDRTIVVGR